MFCWVLEQFKIRHSNFCNRWRGHWIIHWVNHLHFFDPIQSFRSTLSTSTYLSLESYLPTSECCFRGAFVKMKFRNLQFLLVCIKILWISSLTKDDWISTWRSWLASRISNRMVALTKQVSCSDNWIFGLWFGLLRVFNTSINFWDQLLHPIIFKGNLRKK